jgi:hypothetical protein
MDRNVLIKRPNCQKLVEV